MSTYLSFELDAKKRAQRVARALDVHPGIIAWGLLELWEHAWSEQSETVTAVDLEGCFGLIPRVAEVLAVYGFIEAVDGGYRVKGADRYLRIRRARSEGGKKAAGNLKRGAERPENQREEVPGSPRLPPGSLPAPAGDQPGMSPGSRPALTPSTEHRAPNRSAAADQTDPAIEFFAWSQQVREERFPGAFPENRPAGYDGWFERASAEVKDLARLKAAFRSFVADPWASKLKPPGAMQGFIGRDNWRKHVPAVAPPEKPKAAWVPAGTTTTGEAA